MSANGIERLYDDYVELRRFLTDGEEFRLRSIVEETFPKALLLAVASHFEKRLTDAVEVFAREATSDDHPLVSLIQQKAIARQYHTWFNWDARNANRFFRMFGPDFEKYAARAVGENDELRLSIHAFMQIGEERNMLVHEDFADFPMEKTSSEIYDLYRSATTFVDWFPSAIRDFAARP